MIKNPMPSQLCVLLLGLLLHDTAQAAVIIPEKGGFGGFVNLGVGMTRTKSNMLSSVMSGKVDLGKSTINSLTQSPESESNMIPSANFELSYTFAKSRTQLHIGNLLEDFLEFDLHTLAGVRQDIGSAGLIGASILTTSVATEVWRDPYVTNAKRADTERTGTGYRFYWQQIMGSGLEVRYSSQEVDIDKERSGEALGLSEAERRLLRRDGDNKRFQVSYEISTDDKRHIITPGLSYIDQDRDGKAMASDGVAVNLNYIYQHSARWRYVFNASYADLDSKKSNPIYGEKDSANRYGASATVFFSKPFGLENWALNATAGYFDEDHDINFYDATAAVFVVGMFRQF